MRFRGDSWRGKVPVGSHLICVEVFGCREDDYYRVGEVFEVFKHPGVEVDLIRQLDKKEIRYPSVGGHNAIWELVPNQMKELEEML
jgi:hypothetical protein